LHILVDRIVLDLAQDHPLDEIGFLVARLEGKLGPSLDCGEPAAVAPKHEEVRLEGDNL